MSAKKKKATTKTTTGASKAKEPKVGAKLLDQLVQAAKAVRENAYAPYSKYLVGAALATKSGKIYAGCNVENASFSAGICAERGAIMQMVAAGEKDLVACAVVTRDGASPCGVCRQMLVEFAKDLPIVIVSVGELGGEQGRVVQLADLLPNAFELKS